MGGLKQAVVASRTERDERLEKERQLEDTSRLSRFDQADISTASESCSDTASEPKTEDLTLRPIEKPNLKRRAEDDLSNARIRAVRPSTGSSSSKNTLKFANGAIRITRTPGRKGDKNCINLEDVIDKGSLVSACIYSFFIGDEELFKHLPFSHSSDAVPIYIGRDANFDSTIPAACVQAGLTIKGKITRKQLDTMLPKLSQLNRKRYGKNYHSFYAWSSGSSHSKVLALVYPAFLRIVITSCNMMDIDTLYGDNQWYIHDLPKVSTREKCRPSQFEEQFLEHLRALKTPDEFIDSIDGVYDYSSVKVHLATSVPGTHSGAKAEQHGLLRLRRIVQDLDLGLPQKKTEDELQLEVCAASIGNLNAKWLNGFYDCALGKPNLAVAGTDSGVPDLKLFYPTVGDVKGAHKSAQDAASNIGCHTRPWDAASQDIKNIFYHYQSKDVGRLFHQKLILAYNRRDKAALPYYIYLGSANLSQSAWGALEVDKKANEATCSTKLTKMTNFECGVVVPGHLIKDLLEPGTRSWADGIVPHKQDARRYDLSKDHPWNDPRWVEGYREDWDGNN